MLEMELVASDSDENVRMKSKITKAKSRYLLNAIRSKASYTTSRRSTSYFLAPQTPQTPTSPALTCSPSLQVELLHLQEFATSSGLRTFAQTMHVNAFGSLSTEHTGQDPEEGGGGLLYTESPPLGALSVVEGPLVFIVSFLALGNGV